MNMIEILSDRMTGKAPKGSKRSSKWYKVRREMLDEYPECGVCNSKTKRVVHHKIPFHIAPDLELVKSNLEVLCESKRYGINCHLLIGHLGNWRRFNASVEVDIMTWYIKLSTTGFDPKKFHTLF